MYTFWSPLPISAYSLFLTALTIFFYFLPGCCMNMKYVRLPSLAFGPIEAAYWAVQIGNFLSVRCFVP